MSSFFRFFAERHKLASLFTIMIILLGLSTWMGMQRDQWPNLDLGEMYITTLYPGASPEDVELNVTNKLEDELEHVTSVERITSVSMENISSIHVVIDPDAKDQEEVKREVRDAVSRVTDFPAEVTDSPLIMDVETSMIPVVEVGVSGDLPYRELREIAKLFEKKLEVLPGVSSINRFGYRAREIKVEVIPESMDKYQIPLQQLIAAIRARNIRATAGTLESYTSEKDVVTLAQFHEPMEVGDVIVRSTLDGSLIRVRDVAIVQDDFEEEKVLSRMNGRSAVSFEVTKSESADIIRTVNAIRELVEQEHKNLPEGVEILYSNDFSRYVRNRFRIVRMNALIGLILVVIMLTTFLNRKIAFWVAMGIPVSLMGVISLLPLFDMSLNSISLSSMILVLGIIVDDGIIISENIYRRRQQGDPPLVAAVEGIREVFLPVLTTILTTFLAFAPMFFMPGMLGKFIFVIPLVISLALLVSLAEVIIALPAHLMRGLHRDKGHSKEDFRYRCFETLRSHYGRVIPRILRFRYAFVFLSIILLVGALLYAANFMKFVLFPPGMADQFWVMIELPKGAPLQATSDKAKEIEELIANLPKGELGSFTTRIGSQFEVEQRTTAERENHAFLSVNLTPFSERDRTADQIVEALRQKTDILTGFTKITYDIDSGGPPVGKPVTIRVVGADDAMRARLASAVEEFLKTIEGVKDIARDDRLGKDQVEVKLDDDTLSRLGLTVADVAQSIRIAYDGEVVTSVRYGDEDVDFRVMLHEKVRKSLNKLSEILIPNRQGQLVKLRAATAFKTGPGAADYHHYDGERTITITADIVPGTTTPLEVTKTVLNRFDLNRDWPGMRFVVGGEAQETEESMRGLFRIFVLAAVGIYFLLVLLFNSMTQPFLVMIAIPFGIVGVIIAFALHGEPLGFVGMLGIIGLAGVVVNDSLVLVDHVNQLRKQRPDESVFQLVVEGGSNRLRAVILTSLTTIAALIPLAYGIGGTDPYMAPMALALGYGLLFATPLTLILVPCLYMIFHDIGRLVSRARNVGDDESTRSSNSQANLI
jgi:multidrug efflux pump subunit AcrB